MKKLLNNEMLKKIFMYLSLFVFSMLSLVLLVQSNIIFSILFFIIAIYISIKAKIKWFPYVLFFGSLIIRLILIKIWNYPQVDDFKTLLKASKMFANNDYSFKDMSYFSSWGYQVGVVIYQGLVLKIVNSAFALKMLNAIYSSTLVLIIYLVGRKVTSEKAARMASICYMLFPYPLYLNTVIANHHLATFLMYLGILFLIKDERKTKDFIIAGILIALGNIIRPEAIIVILAFLLYEFFNLKKDKVLKVIKNVLVFITIYFVITTSASVLISKANLSNSGLKNTDPMWKFVLGLNHESYGFYTEDDLKYQGNKKAEIKVIKQRLFTNPIKLCNLFAHKTSRFWLQSEIFAKNDVYKNRSIKALGMSFNFEKVQSIVLDFNKVLYGITLLMSVFGVVLNRKKILKDKSFFFVILTTITFFVFLLIEIQPRYAYFIHISIFILSCYGYDYFLDKIMFMFNKKKKLK